VSGEETVREKLANFLLQHPGEEFSLEDLAYALGLKRSESKRLYEDLVHVSKTLWRKTDGKVYVAMVPPVCLSCGYVFKDLKRPRRPSRCPRCKSERIRGPLFVLVEKK